MAPGILVTKISQCLGCWDVTQTLTAIQFVFLSHSMSTMLISEMLLWICAKRHACHISFKTFHTS